MIFMSSAGRVSRRGMRGSQSESILRIALCSRQDGEGLEGNGGKRGPQREWNGTAERVGGWHQRRTLDFKIKNNQRKQNALWK